MADKQTVTVSELLKLQEQENRPTPLTADEVSDYAAAALLVLRGLSRREKLRVLTRMRRIV